MVVVLVVGFGISFQGASESLKFVVLNRPTEQ